MMDCRVKPGNATLKSTFIYSARHARIVGQMSRRSRRDAYAPRLRPRSSFFFIRRSLPEGERRRTRRQAIEEASAWP
jgi:hypothetical protein